MRKTLGLTRTAGLVTACLILFAAVCSAAPQADTANTARTVAVLPFTMNTQQDLSFLKKGIFDMFSSRINYADQVLVLTRETLDSLMAKADSSLALASGMNEAKARNLGAFLKVDYVLFGSLTLFGNSMSLDVNMIDIKTGQPPLTFFRQSDNPGAVIPELNKIAEEINFKVFGRQTIQYQNQQALAQVYERQADAYRSPLERFVTLLNFKGVINSLACADLDGDKKNEVVVVDGSSVRVYKTAVGGKLIPVQTIENESAAVTNISVDAVDLDRNGAAEIFVTAINDRQQRVSSFVIVFRKGKYVRKEGQYPWYFRALKDRNGIPVLYAQGHSSKKGPWHPKGVFRVVAANASYEAGDRLAVPNQEFSVLSMADASSVTKDGSSLYIYTGKDGRLILFNESGKVEWMTDEGFGGSSLRYELAKTQTSGGEREFVFFQPKMAIYDYKSDGRPELFVMRNIESSDYLFANTRVFKKGRIEVHGFNDMGLESETAPKRLPGVVTSLAVADYDNDGRPELLVTMIKKGGTIISSKRNSIMVAYELVE